MSGRRCWTVCVSICAPPSEHVGTHAVELANKTLPLARRILYASSVLQLERSAREARLHRRRECAHLDGGVGVASSDMTLVLVDLTCGNGDAVAALLLFARPGAGNRTCRVAGHGGEPEMR